MLNLSIRENLLLANRHAGEEEIRNACEKANILSFIESLPDKFEQILVSVASNYLVVKGSDYQ